MARQNVPLIALNRGLISPKALARVDLDRTRLSAEVYNNWVPETVGSMSIRPGTKYFGSSLRDSGAEFLEFVAATDDVALLELTDETMRVWLGDDAHALALLGRPLVGASVDFTDTGWTNASTGGTVTSVSPDLIPVMTTDTTSGVTVSASSSNALGGGLGGRAWQAGDDSNATGWADTGILQGGTLPSWLKVDFGAGNTKTVSRYTLRAGPSSAQLDNVPRSWDFQGNDVDTGSDASWTLLDTGGDQTAWAVSEKREFAVGSPQAFRFYRWNVKEITGGGDLSGEVFLAEAELFEVDSSTQARFGASGLTLNANAIGSRAKATKRVIVDTGDYGVEHSLDIEVSRGPVVLRVGSSAGDDDFISETSIGTGNHNLAFTPSSNFHITFQSDALVNRIVSSIAIGDSGTVEIEAPWTANDLDNIRYDQSADVVYVDCAGVRPSKIERRGTGRSWSVVDYAPNNGPFLAAPSSAAKMSVSYFFGNTTMNSDNPFFAVGHVGALIRMFNEGQGGKWRLGALDAKTDTVQVTGIGDTGTNNDNERRIIFSVSGTWAGEIAIERSRDGPQMGFKTVDYADTGVVTDTGTFSLTLDDPDDNSTVHYRARIIAYTSGAPLVTITYPHGGVTGIARVTDYNSNTSVGIEVLSRFSDTGPSDNWQEGFWSDARSFPSAVALHGGRLGHANGGNLFLSVSDDFENFDDATEGDAAPIIRTLGSGPVDNIVYLISLLRLIIGTAGAEIALKSSSLDEPVTPTNSSASAFSTQGSANMRALKMDNRAIVVQRSKQRIFMIGAGTSGATFGDFEGSELTTLVPDLLAAGIVSVAIQRQPDTRIHVVLADGTVGILTYEPGEEIVCWYTWSTAGFVERAMSLPGLSEDAVYYHIRRTINGVTKRYLEKWAMQAECEGDTGLSFLADCASSYTDTGRTNSLVDIAPQLGGESVVLWADLDTGSTPFVDLSPDVNGVQTTYAVDTGGDIALSLTSGVHHAVAGLAYVADWRSTKLAFAAEGGTALSQMKRSDKICFVLYKTHNNGIFFGSDTGHLDPLPRVNDAGAVVDPDKIFATYDKAAIPFPGLWDEDSRVHLRAKAPRPATVMALVPTVGTSDKL